MKNRGVLIGRRSTDFVAGALPYEVRNLLGDWTPYLPLIEKQHFDGGDSMACVSFSAVNAIEMQVRLLTDKEANYSDRFVAKMSGTTQQGNWLYVVADTIRKCGLVNEEEWPALPKFTWESYYSDIPDWIKTKALKWLTDWEVKYEFLDPITPDNLIKHLKHAPLQIVIPGHAVVEILQEKDVYNYFDTYDPYVKIRKEMPIQALKVVLNAKSTPSMNNLRLLRAGKDVFRLRDGEKDLFLNVEAFKTLDGRWGKIENVTQQYLDSFPDGYVLIAVRQE